MSRLVRAVAALRALAHRYDADAAGPRRAALEQLAGAAIGGRADLRELHALLLFMAAHPADAGELALVEAVLARLAQALRAQRDRHGRLDRRHENQGLPWCDTVTRFSHDMLRRLLQHPDCTVRLEHFGEPQLDLNDVLRLTLPPAEWSATTRGLAPLELLDALGVRPGERLRFIVDQLSRLDAQPFVKDRLFDALDLHVRVRPRRARFATAANRLPVAAPYFHAGLARRIDAREWLDRPLPPPRALDEAARHRAVAVIRDTLVLTARETDPATYLDERSLRLFDLERGLAVAVYTMTPERQLPCESYVGFALFKNGFGVAYGGAWILGARADFGMNIFEPYRGGESGLMMCQVLRVYRRLFELRHVEVDAYQFGLDNEDGIASGAYWFYHRHGFRSIDLGLARLAAREAARLAARPGRRSSARTLRALTGSSVALDFGGAVPPPLAELTSRVTRHVARHWRGDRAAAERDAVARFVAATGPMRGLSPDEARVQGEVALLAAALGIDDARELALLRRMVRTRPADVYRYQRLLRDWFALR